MHNIPKATLGRLPKYLEYILSVDTEYVSAAHIARELGLGEVQVRKDLSSVCANGRPRMGYIRSELIADIEACLGSGKVMRAVIVGAGKLGCALLDYEGFSEYGIEITCAFDIDPAAVRPSPVGRPIYPLERFCEIVTEQGIKAGIITVPKSCAQEIADMMIKCGISAIWSFAPTAIKVPKGVSLREENLALSLAHLFTRNSK